MIGGPSPCEPTVPREAAEVSAPAAAATTARAPAPAVELQRLADEMVRRATLVELPAEVALQLELKVPLLREVGVELRLSGGRLRACLQASDRAGYDRLRAAAPDLEQALQRRGLLADPVEVRFTRGTAG